MYIFTKIGEANNKNMGDIMKKKNNKFAEGLCFAKLFIFFIVGCILIIPFISLVNVRVGGNSFKGEIEDLIWSDYVLSEKLPEPKTLKGKLNYDSSSSLSINIVGVDKKEYRKYVNACKDKGFTLDIYNSSNSFSAKNEEGYSLYIYYNDDDKGYSISLHEPEKKAANQ